MGVVVVDVVDGLFLVVDGPFFVPHFPHFFLKEKGRFAAFFFSLTTRTMKENDEKLPI